MTSIVSALKNRLNPEYYLDDAREDYDNEDDFQEAVDTAVSDSVLSIDIEIHKQVMLGVGGPTVYFDITFSADPESYAEGIFKIGDPIRGKFVHTGFDDRKEIELTEQELQQVIDMFCLEF